MNKNGLIELKRQMQWRGQLLWKRWLYHWNHCFVASFYILLEKERCRTFQAERGREGGSVIWFVGQRWGRRKRSKEVRTRAGRRLHVIGRFVCIWELQTIDNDKHLKWSPLDDQATCLWKGKYFPICVLRTSGILFFQVDQNISQRRTFSIRVVPLGKHASRRW